MAVSVLDNIIGPYAPGWSTPGWTTQGDVSAAEVAATGGTYETKAPEKKEVSEKS